jgi:thiamine biosynthesis lipoprotein
MMRYLIVWRWLLVGMALAQPGFPCAVGERELSRFEFSQVHMGVTVRIVAYAADEPAAARACAAAFRRFAEIDEIASDYRPASELMRLCDRAGGPPVPVSAELFHLLERSQDLARRSRGAFDVTVGPYVALWREARRSGRLPSAPELARARECVGWTKMRLDRSRRTVQLLVPRMRLDLGGIAKGHAADRAQSVLREHGITRALIEAGGEIVVSDSPPGRRGWQVDTADVAAGSEPRSWTLTRAAVSTSGDTVQFVEIGGRRYSHIIDPRTGLGLTSRVAATVIARDGITADSLSTAVSVLGAEEGTRLVRTVRGATVFVRRGESTGGG